MKSDTVALVTHRRHLADFVALTKPRLNSLVVATTGVGYLLGVNASFEISVALHVLIGAGLVAGGAAALNQISERDIDESMHRTRQRPIPTGRLTPTEGRLFAVGISVMGLVELALGTNLVAAAVAATTTVVYVCIYTPLKRRTSLATIIGAIPGALPPVIGWTAARGALTVEAWVLFGIVFFWQMPHFHALSWMHRKDFRRAGLPLVATQDEDGRRTARHAAFFSLLLLPMSLAPTAVGLSGKPYLLFAGGLGLCFLFLAIQFMTSPTETRARRLFIGSLVYLPALWVFLLTSRLW